MNSDTIVAVATPPGRGGVGIIRLSGPQSLDIGLTLTKHQSVQPRVAVFCSFFQKSQEDSLLDQGILLYFKAPHSFTGEDVVEIQVHGSPVVLDMILKECIFLGARLARPGEFSERAFLNDKMDLTQAEAIADLIHASSETAAKMAVRSLQGDFSKKINQLNQEIIHLRMYVEAAIDFPEEEIDFLNDGVVTHQLNTLIEHLAHIQSEATQGALLREGLNIVIAGKPNAGKSTLINRLAQRDIAIVTEVAGTTRDVMREQITLDDMPLHIIDTAGLRDSEDIVEQEGIKRAWQEVSKADCVLYVVDASIETDHHTLLKDIHKTLPKDTPVIIVFNKIDKIALKPKREQYEVSLSAQSGEGMEHLKTLIKHIAGYQPTEGQFIARRRHLDALERAMGFLVLGQLQLTRHRAGELLAEDLRQAHRALCDITGEFTSDDLLGTIFSSFCIGK